MPLRETLTSTWDHIQGFLFPMPREEVGPPAAQHERLAVVLDLAGTEAFVQMWLGAPGRPLEHRHALARALWQRPFSTWQQPRGSSSVSPWMPDYRGYTVGSGREHLFARLCRVCRERLTGRMHEAPIERTHKERLAGWGTVSALNGHTRQPWVASLGKIQLAIHISRKSRGSAGCMAWARP